MKIRIMALIFASVMLAALLTGCGSAEPEQTAPVAVTETIIEETTEPATEPTTEPVTMPTEPPTLLEEQGYVLWDGAVSAARDPKKETWIDQGDFIPLSNAVTGKYENVQMQFAVVGSDRKEYRDQADTDVDILMYEIPGSAFDDGIGMLDEKLKPFYKADSGSETYEEWTGLHADSKLIYAQVKYLIRGTELYLQTIENGVKMKDLRVSHSYPDIVDAATGSIFSVKEKYDPSKPEVGSWTLDGDHGQMQMQAWFDRQYSWHVQEGKQADLNVTFEYYVLVPAAYDDFAMCMQEYLTAEEPEQRLILGRDGKSWWGAGTIFDEEFVNCEEYGFRFFGLKTGE